jgi:O-antigen/teichoic acid export membrane protein/glycosyltransferase involved in cell wall biosynthesis
MTATTPQLEPARDGAGAFQGLAPNVRRLSISQVIRRSSRMALLLLAARMLGVDVFGAYALVLTVVEMMSIISGFGYMDFLTREVAKRPETAWALGLKVTWLRWGYIVPSLGLALLALGALHFSTAVLLNVCILTLTLAPRATVEAAQGVLKGLGRFSPLPWIEVVQGSAAIASAAFFVAAGFGLRGVITGEIVGATAGAAFAVGSVIRHATFVRSETPPLRQLLRSTFAFNIYPFIVNVYDRVDVVLLARLAGTFATGIYSLPYRIYATPSIIPYSLMGALLPGFSSTGAGVEAREKCAAAMKILYIAALLMLLVTLTFADPVILLVLGNSYKPSILTLKILVWAAGPAFLNSALNTLFLAAHREKVFLWTASVCTVFNVAANLILIPRFSFIAAAAVTVATECLLLAQNFYLTRRFLGQVILPKDAGRITVYFLVAIAAFWGLHQAVPQLWAGSAVCLAFALVTAANVRRLAAPFRDRGGTAGIVKSLTSIPTIAFDTWALGPQARHHGINVYANHLLEHFRDLAPKYSVEIAPFITAGTANDANGFSAVPGFRPRQTRFLRHSRWWRWGGAQFAASLHGVDLIFSPSCTTLCVGRPVPAVVTIHDLIPVVVPWKSTRITQTLRFLYWWAAKFSQGVITDSVHSKNDLVRLYGVPESKVDVVYLGCDAQTFNDSPADGDLQRAMLTRLGVMRPYVVHHGVIKPYKNLKRLIQAHRLLLERNPNLELDLVLAGPLGWEYDDVLEEARRCNGSRAKVVVTYALSNADLVFLLKGASLAVIPSLYEGFCLPMVESMACGVPTIAADRSCLPEVSGGVLRYFNPESIDDIAATMEQVLESAELRKELSEKGRARAREFEWRRCAEETLAVLARWARATS